MVDRNDQAEGSEGEGGVMGILGKLGGRNRISPQERDVRLTTAEDVGKAHLINLEEYGLQQCSTQYEQMKQLRKIRDMPCSIANKRLLRESVMKSKLRLMGGFEGWKTRQKMSYHKFKLALKQKAYVFELWSKSFKEIEGHFGSGVLSYFIFLKWLMQLNLIIFFLLLLFIVIPQTVFSDKATSFSNVPCENVTSGIYSVIEWHGDEVQNCSLLYETYILETTSTANATYKAVDYIADFFQGEGWMEDTPLFYGYYSSLQLSVNITYVRDIVSQYNLPLAYIIVVGICFIVSLVIMVRQSAKGFKEILVSEEDKFYQHCNKVFGSWDYTLYDLRNVNLKKKSIYNDIKFGIVEKKDEERRKKRSSRRLAGLILVRLLINLFVLATLGGSGYLIYYMAALSVELSHGDDYLTYPAAVRVLVSFIPSITITVLNIVMPFVFRRVVLGEDYTPGVEVKITLIRTVFLRLASLAVLFSSIYSDVTCGSKDDCNVGTDACKPRRCWESYVGQQLYRLIILDLIIQLAITTLIEFPRKLFVTGCTNKVAKRIGSPTFIIPKNVLDLVYSQTLCWLGVFFSPIIPAICILKLFLIFYVKKISLLSNFVPNDRPYRASRSNSFFVVVLLISFVLCCFPIIYVIAVMAPSRGCGPFRPYGVMYDSIVGTVCTWPDGFQHFLGIITSMSFNIPVVLLLCLTIYYQSIVSELHKERIKLLKDQLTTAAKEKRALMKTMGRLSVKDEIPATPGEIRYEERHETHPISRGQERPDALLANDRVKIPGTTLNEDMERFYREPTKTSSHVI